MGFKTVLRLDSSRVAINQMDECHGRSWARGRDDGKNGSSSDAAIPTMMWEHGDCPFLPPAYRTFDLVIDKGDLDCVMLSSDQI